MNTFRTAYIYVRDIYAGFSKKRMRVIAFPTMKLTLIV